MSQIVIYSIAIAIAFTLMGYCTEWLATMRKLPRRYIWPLTMVLSIAWAAGGILWVEPVATAMPDAGAATVQQPPAIVVREPAVAQTAQPAVPQLVPIPGPATGPVWSPPSGRTLLTAWVIASSALLLLFIGASLQLQRRARRWRRETVLGREVLVSESTGPALLGTLRPRIVVPEWFMTEPPASQALILQHEEQHMTACDSLLLRLALLVAIAVPWNLPLWWQLRRLRQAIEMDCDARVLRHGATPGTYGEVLLAVTRRAGSVPAGLVAMGDPVSALERRIQHLSPDPARQSVVRAAAALLVWTASIGAAVALEAPSLQRGATALPRLLPPGAPTDQMAGYRDAAQQALVQQHPELVNGAERDDTAYVFMVLRADGSVESSRLRHEAPLLERMDMVTGGASATYGSGAMAGVVDLVLRNRMAGVNGVPDGLATVPLTGGSAAAPMGTAGGAIHLDKGTSIAEGATLKSQLRLSYMVQPAGYDSSRSEGRVQQIMLAAHPELLLPISGDTFNRVTVYLTEDGRIDRHHVELRYREQLRPYGDINPALFARLFEPLDLQPEQLGTMGITNIYADGSSMIGEPGWMIVRYAWPRRPGEPIGGTPSSPATAMLSYIVSFSHTDAAAVLDHHLPGALNEFGTTAAGTPWLVLSRDGQVVRSGYLLRSQGRPASLAMLQTEVPDLRLAEFRPMTVVRQYGVSYAFNVLFAWLAPEDMPETAAARSRVFLGD